MINYAMQNAGVIAFVSAAGAGTTNPAVDLRTHLGFSLTAQVVADITTDAVFNIQGAPVSPTDPCAPGAFADVPEVPICDKPAQPAAASHFTIPAGTKAGAVCAIAMPCKPGAFAKVLA